MGWFDLEYKTEAMKTLIERKKFEEVLELADDTNWKRVKDVKLICTVSDIYKLNKQYAKSKELLLAARKRQPEDKNIVYALCETCIKLDRTAEAQDYYEEYIHLAPDSSNCYVLRYKMAVAQEKSLEERIEILEDLKAGDGSVKWRYELARLYKTAGDAERCKAECDEIIEQFGGSKFAAKAEELKNKLG